MKTLKHLERSKPFWSILLLSLVFFLLRLPSVIEPYWYGDEGIYEVIGQALRHGRLLYSQIWDNKPPLLYVVFALFNGDQESVRFLSMLVGIASTIILFSLSQKLFKKLSSSIIATACFTILFATPFLEGNIANAENFMLLPVLGAGLLMYIYSNSHSDRVQNLFNKKPVTQEMLKKALFSKITITGILLGIAFLFKIVAIFDLIAFTLFLLFASFRETHPTHTISRSALIKHFLILKSEFLLIIAGFLAPLLVTLLYFLSQGTIKDFIQSAFAGNIGYVGYGNAFLHIPQGLLIIKIMLLAITIGIIFMKRQKLTQNQLFILIWLTFSFFNAFFSQRPYTHYLLVFLPSFCLLVGWLFDMKNTKEKFGLLLFSLIMIFLIKQNFWLNTPKKIALYYKNAGLFITGQKDVKSYRYFFDNKTPRDYELASLITKNTRANDSIFIWGDSAQIYALSHKLPISKYTVAYHIKQNTNAMTETQNIISIQKPKFIIILPETSKFPFSLPFYSVSHMVSGAIIYERTF